jgi:hypothetical protein
VQKPEAQVLALASVVGALLVGFVVVVVREVGATVGAWAGGRGDPYELFAVSLTGLVGAVFAVALGASRRLERSSRAVAVERLQRRFGQWYVVTYALAGGTALVVCLVRLGASTSLLRSLAATFLGTSVAAASSFFGLHDPDEDPPEAAGAQQSKRH